MGFFRDFADLFLPLPAKRPKIKVSIGSPDTTRFNRPVVPVRIIPIEIAIEEISGRYCNCGHHSTQYVTRIDGKIICRGCNQMELNK